jgi:hypothetical protein
MKMRLVVILLAVAAIAGCTTTKQFSNAEFRPPEGSYRLIVMRPDITVSALTAGGVAEPREDWTTAARANVIAALRSQQSGRGGDARIAVTREEAGADGDTVIELERLHKAVGRSIQIHKYAPGQQLPTKRNEFDWTLGEAAVRYGKATQYDYALFLSASDSFATGGRVALQAVSFIGCVVGVCLPASGGMQYAFVSLVDLKSGRVVWFNFLSSEDGDIRTAKGAEEMVTRLLGDMKPGSRATGG